MTELETRSVELRADADTGTVEGIAVPWGQRATIGGAFEEMFERGSIVAQDVKLFWQHREVIGKVIASEDREDGLFIRAQISDTTQGRDARALLKDGVVDRFSVGFIPMEHRTEKDGLIVRTRVDLREVSAVTFPAYSGATITEARNQTPPIPKENTVSENTDFTADLTEVRESVESLDRRFEVLAASRLSERGEPAIDKRSAGAVLKAAVEGDEPTIEMLNRAYTGGVLADGYTPNAYVGDLTRLIDNASPIRSVFSKGTLPSTGRFLEYTQLKSNTSTVSQQVKEGDTLAYGKVAVESKTAPIFTYGGYTSLSRQEIERSQVNMLTLALNAQAIAAARQLDANFRVEFDKAVADARTAGNNIGTGGVPGTATDWLGTIVDAAGQFQDNGLSLDGLLVDSSTFKQFLGLSGSDGRPLMSISGQAVNTVGTAVPRTLRGEIAGVQIVADPALTVDSVAFYNADALREYTSPFVRLSDGDITNLTNQYSLYFYGAIAHELPVGIVPVGVGA
ncbi:HK97 family phage prohead protease [Frigoribacterium sp. VKM Ac-2836]|uniref:HK97 family phage prohead protease n=1 Tax=Frigoribacterium sp. VKM Ac-2836 TaxID=2739014 RepID=UPI001566F656|nr:HK97 family phage prohead protease [Frigoribacterium sp. VKM Ac-2836]